jgi:DNA-binding IclR family transcriptional regulator
LLNISEVAQAHFSPLQVAQPEMRSLADEYDAVCTAAFRERHDVVVRERAAAVSHLGFSSPRGTRHPLLPQFAAPFFAASTPADIKAWVDGFDPPCSDAQIEALFKGVEFVRAHGYLFSVQRPGTNLDRESSQWLSERRYFDTPIVAKFDLAADETYKPIFILAPVYDSRGKVAFALALQGFQKAFTGAQIEHIGTRVREVCARITAFLARSKESKG